VVTFFDISLGVRLNSMKKHMTLFLCLSACLLIVIIVLIKPNSFGVLANHIEDDARAKQKIDNAWRVSQTANDKIAAMIFFSEALDDYKFSIYIKHNWGSFGYHFSYGGSCSAIMDGIQRFSYGNKGFALISMNHSQISRIEVNNGVHISSMAINSELPFALVFPNDCGSIVLYDKYNNEIQITCTEDCV